MENKKSNVGWIIIIIILLLLIGALTLIVLKEKGIIKIGNTSKENNVEQTTTNNSNVTNNTSKAKKESKIVYSGLALNGNKDFGKITFNAKEVELSYTESDGEGKLMVGDKSIDIIGGTLDNIAIMGDYFVVGINQDGYRFELYNNSLEKVDKVGNSLGLLTGTTTDTSKLIIDDNNLIYYQCDADYNSRDNDTLKTYNLKIDSSKIEKILLSTNTGVVCTSQR